MSPATLALRYAGFAVIATIANLGLQRVVLGWGEGAVIYAGAVAAGTLIGLVVKYILDKRWHGTKFALYTAMGLVTTAIFWGTETAFWLIWGTDLMREAGAVLGLSVGYVTKYLLDRRYVFADTSLKAEGI
jgi:putative flippase GtrA